MIDTQGGKYGGITRGILSGAELSNSLINSAQERDLRQKQETRLDQQTQIALHQARAETLRSMLDDANDQIASLAKGGAGDDQLTAAMQRKQDLNQQLYGANGAIVRAAGGQVLDGVQQTMGDQRALASGQATPQDIGADRLYNVTSLINPQPITLINGYDHPEGMVPVQQHLDNIHQGMQNGDHTMVRDSAGHLLAHTASHLTPEHEDYAPGLNIPYDRSQPHGHIAGAADAVGRIATAHAAINGDHPEAAGIRQMLVQAHEAGGQDRVNFARQLLYLSGGVKGLAKTLATPDESEQKFMFLQSQLKNAYTSQGMDPQAAAAKATQDAINRIADPMEVEMQRGRNEIAVANIHAGATRDAAKIRTSAAGRSTLSAQIQSISEQLSDPDLDPDDRSALEAARNSLSHRYDKAPAGGAKGHVEGERKDFADPKDATGLRKVPYIWSVQQSQWVPADSYKVPAAGGQAGGGAAPGGGTAPAAARRVVGDVVPFQGKSYVYTGGDVNDRNSYEPMEN